MRVVVKIMAPFWVLNIIRHRLGYPRRDPNFHNHPYAHIAHTWVLKYLYREAEV